MITSRIAFSDDSFKFGRFVYFCSRHLDRFASGHIHFDVCHFAASFRLQLQSRIVVTCQERGLQGQGAVGIVLEEADDRAGAAKPCAAAMLSAEASARRQAAAREQVLATRRATGSKESAAGDAEGQLRFEPLRCSLPDETQKFLLYSAAQWPRTQRVKQPGLWEEK